jgi:hypothetical protein
MSTQDDVRRIALSLPATTESPGEFGFRVGGRKFVWIWRERVKPKKPKVPNPEVIVLPVADLGEKAALLAIDPEAFFSTDHYAGDKAVLVRLSKVDTQELTELITDSWCLQAPEALVEQLESQLR